MAKKRAQPRRSRTGPGTTKARAGARKLSARTRKPAARKATARKAARPRTRKTPPAGTPPRALPGWITHTELASADPDATRVWCATVLGWTFKTSVPTPSGDYHLFAYSETGGGGIRASNAPEVPGSIPYIQVADTRAAVAAAVRAGAEVMLPPEPVAEGVTIAIVRAPGGVPIGLAGP
jgi:hypothetical protein